MPQAKQRTKKRPMGELIFFPLKNATAASRERLKDRVSEEDLEAVDERDLSAADRPNPTDPSFQSDLDYEGYQSIEESDNDAYESLDAEKNPHAQDELAIEDREEDPDMGEESPIDPQGNRK